ncbi:hypothetical protein DFS34DRAFT_609657 [Phlyctochytrium arcticum]|nr:hypothetical protein DFS34DRAFT_609657 [Phlyctochytrium arcticum]
MDVTEAEQRFLDQVYTVPEWVDWELIERGRAVFWKNMGGIQVVLLYASLAGGFSIPRVNDVLVQTGYLTSAKHLQRRLLETGQMINDVMQAGLRPGSDGWMSVLRVRLLHCAVRRRQHRATGQIVPINQTDLIGTLLGFQCSTIMGLAKMWTFLSPAERDAYTHLWRYVGLLIGVDPAHDPLQHGFDVTCTGLKDYLQLYFIPDEISIKLANTLLDTVSSTAATRSRPSRALNVSLTRHFLSDSLAAALDLPKQNIWYRFLALMALGLVYVLGQLAYLPFVGPRMIGERKRRMARIMDGISKHTAGSIHQPSLTSPVDAPHMKSA